MVSYTRIKVLFFGAPCRLVDILQNCCGDGTFVCFLYCVCSFCCHFIIVNCVNFMDRDIVIIITSTEGRRLCFHLCLSVCLHVCLLHYSKSYEWILVNFLAGVGRGARSS